MKIALLVLIVISISAQGQNEQFSMDASEQLFNITSKIQGFKDSLINGRIVKYSSTGTGFFFNYSLPKGPVLVLVSNNHVIQNCKTGLLKFNSSLRGKPNYGDVLSIELDNFDQLWICHPTQDLAILPLNPILNVIKEKYGREAFTTFLDEALIPSEQQLDSLTALEEVLMIGYPKGFSDSSNNLPIARSGMTATPPYLNFNKEPHFLLDIPIYTGSSGSPVVLYNSISYRNYKTNSTVMGSRFYFMGIATSSRNYIARGSTVSAKKELIIPTETSLPFDIAIVLKSKVLLEIKKLLESRGSQQNYIRLLNSSIKK
jgi:hypothetical protein